MSPKCAICTEEIDHNIQGCLISHKYSSPVHPRCHCAIIANGIQKHQSKIDDNNNNNNTSELLNTCHVCSKEIRTPISECIIFPKCKHQWMHLRCLKGCFIVDETPFCRFCHSEDPENNLSDQVTKNYHIKKINPFSVTETTKDFILVENASKNFATFLNLKHHLIPSFETPAKQICHELQKMREMGIDEEDGIPVGSFLVYLKEQSIIKSGEQAENCTLLSTFQTHPLMLLQTKEDIEIFFDNDFFRPAEQADLLLGITFFQLIMLGIPINYLDKLLLIFTPSELRNFKFDKNIYFAISGKQSPVENKERTQK